MSAVFKTRYRAQEYSSADPVKTHIGQLSYVPVNVHPSFGQQVLFANLHPSHSAYSVLFLELTVFQIKCMCLVIITFGHTLMYCNLMWVANGRQSPLSSKQQILLLGYFCHWFHRSEAHLVTTHSNQGHLKQGCPIRYSCRILNKTMEKLFCAIPCVAIRCGSPHCDRLMASAILKTPSLLKGLFHVLW